MRRIIKRVVTIITTTTWTIQWEEDAAASPTVEIVQTHRTSSADVAQPDTPLPDSTEAVPPLITNLTEGENHEP